MRCCGGVVAVPAVSEKRMEEGGVTGGKRVERRHDRQPWPRYSSLMWYKWGRPFNLENLEERLRWSYLGLYVHTSPVRPTPPTQELQEQSHKVAPAGLNIPLRDYISQPLSSDGQPWLLSCWTTGLTIISTWLLMLLFCRDTNMKIFCRWLRGAIQDLELVTNLDYYYIYVRDTPFWLFILDHLTLKDPKLHDMLAKTLI